MTWGMVAAATVGAVSSNVQSNRAQHAAASAAGQQSEAAAQAATDLRGSADQQQAFFQPFQQVGQQGVDLAGFLGDPNQQASFLQGNPLFQLGLDNLNQQTNRSAASQGRLTAGDTLSQLQNNAQLAGQPLIDRQRQDILNLLNIGTNTAGQQSSIEGNTARSIADLLTGGAAAQAAGTVASANAANANTANLADIGTQFITGFGGT